MDPFDFSALPDDDMNTQSATPLHLSGLHALMAAPNPAQSHLPPQPHNPLLWATPTDLSAPQLDVIDLAAAPDAASPPAATAHPAAAPPAHHAHPHPLPVDLPLFPFQPSHAATHDLPDPMATPRLTGRKRPHPDADPADAPTAPDALPPAPHAPAPPPPPQQHLPQPQQQPQPQPHPQAPPQPAPAPAQAQTPLGRVEHGNVADVADCDDRACDNAPRAGDDDDDTDAHDRGDGEGEGDGHAATATTTSTSRDSRKAAPPLPASVTPCEAVVIDPHAVGQMGGLAFADLCKERAREAYKDARKNEHLANGDYDRIKRRKKNDTSMSAKQKYDRRLRMNQDSAAAARHAQEIYVSVLQKLVHMSEVEKKTFSLELQQLRSTNEQLQRRLRDLQSKVDELEGDRHSSLFSMVKNDPMRAKILDIFTSVPTVGTQPDMGVQPARAV